jgi:hypothetical protein
MARATIAFEDLLLVEKAETVQVHFTLEGEGLRATPVVPTCASGNEKWPLSRI